MPFDTMEIAIYVRVRTYVRVPVCDFIAHLQMEGRAVVSGHRHEHLAMRRTPEIRLHVYLNGGGGVNHRMQRPEQGGARN